MGWTRCFCCKKLQRDFVAQTFALIAPVQYFWQKVSCSYETIPNAPKYYETHQNMSLGSNGVDQVRWLRTITTRFRGTNFCLIAQNLSILQQVSCSYETIPIAPKYHQTDRNISLGSNGTDWVCSLRKNPDVTSCHELLH